MAPSRTHLVVLGATGFTGRFVVDEVVRRLPALQAAVPDFTWAVAGRSRGGLEAIVDGIRKAAPDAKALPAIVEADVKNVESLKHMAQGTHLVLNCVGPYALLGEPVVQAVVEASEALAKQGQAPVDYADLTGEPGFIELMVLKYYERALAAGCTLVHAAAFDSVPADIGVLFAREALRKRGATPASIEIFVGVHIKDGQRMGGNYGTYASAINGFATRKQLSNTRKQLYGPMLPKTTPVAKQRGLGLGLPRRKGRFGVLWGEEVKSYLVPFFFADPAVIRLSQSLAQLQAEQAGGALPESVQIVAWMQLPSLYVLLLAGVLMAFFSLFAASARGRKVLQAHPKLFTGGLFSFEGPSQAQIEATSFETTMVARGHSASLLKGAKQGSGIGTDVTATIKIKGVEPGYRATPALFVAVARTMLAERSKVKKGVLVPAAALADTRLIEDLNEDGRVTFSVQD